MSKQEPVVTSGTVVKELSNNNFRVRLQTGDEPIAYLSGSMVENDIRVVPGDTVKLEFSQHDFSTGRIVERK